MQTSAVKKAPVIAPQFVLKGDPLKNNISVADNKIALYSGD